MLKKFLTFIVLTLSLVSFSVLAKIGPPYPAVWGYDLSNLVKIGEEMKGISTWRMDDGDIWFLTTVSSKKPTREKKILIKFFKGEQLELNKNEMEKVFKILGKQKNARAADSYNEKFTFSDGSTIQFCPEAGNGRGFLPDYWGRFFLKTEIKGATKRYSIFTVSPEVYVWTIHGWEDQKSSPFYYYKLHLASNAVYLKDDTFLIYDEKSHLLLRLNKNFNTQFKPVSPRNFFVIDYSLINEAKLNYLQYYCDLVPYQFIHDVLLSNFYEQLPNSKSIFLTSIK